MKYSLGAMTSYRVSLLAADGSVHREQMIDCASDDEAIDRVGEFDYPHVIDLWQGNRHVARFPPWRGPKLGAGLT